MEYHDVCDVKSKPRMLDYLMNDQIPNETDLSPQHCDLQRVVNTIRNLGLLSESFPQETNNSKIAEDWSVSVDSWLDRVLSLVSSPRESLFNSVTVAKSLDRNMFTRDDLSRMQLRPATSMPASDYISIKLATFASLSDLLKRLGKYSEIKKDVTAHAGKLVQPVLDLLLDNEFSEVVMEGALAVLCIVIDFFPASFLPHYEKAEAVIVSKIISGQCSSNIMKSYAYFLASLPKSKGDKDSWFVMMQDLLTSVEIHLNDVFQCLEQGKALNSVLKLFPLPLFWKRSDMFANDKHNVFISIHHCLVPEREANLKARKSKQLLTCIIPTLMLCCSTMLTNSYPVQVTVPVHQLLTLVKRVLMVNGSFAQASLKSMEIMQEGYVCIELPALQSFGLDLLSAIIKGTSSQLLPHAGYIIRLLKDCLKQCGLPMLRAKLYFIIRTLLISMGIDASWYLNRQKVSDQDVKSATAEVPMQPADKKRKHAAINSSQESRDLDYSDLQNKSSTSSLSLKIAALKALQTLLTMGGVLRSDLRPSVDDLLMNVAENAYDGKWRNDEESEVMSSDGHHADFLLAALHALLASLLSQPSVSQHHLVKGLEMFRKGKQEAGTKIADFCGLAVLVLEKLINSRNVSNGDIPSTSHGCSIEDLEPNESQIPKSFPADQDESLFNYLLNGYNESEATLSNPEDQQREAFLVDIEIERNSDEIVNKEQFQGPFSVAEVKPFKRI
ncbi:hypothetical protein F3Y22_tig00111244pilonHSYRG00063 [Hibiscus syriacus]|uniref:Pre-rRNA-processing protein RIX1 N-terminal domain-containing protein n=1 Tax=Hibiscus syriacus TaxID=106335 RepID=A0A6A2YSS8_HIBSY|nr:hypothetical protein F3Y22_tig00111244pilonHSYRG00063 [Hibiscus syriacus]